MRGEHEVGQSRQTSSLKGGLTVGTTIHPFDGQEGGDASASGTSIFDPTLVELCIRWFSPKGGTVLDPFAGGSVRGIVTSKLGRQYIGIDLRAEQIAANREQAEKICAVGSETVEVYEPEADFQPEFTPVEVFEDGTFAKREDLWTRGGASGAKSRTMFRLADKKKPLGIISAGARQSPQIERAALVANALGIPARLHTSSGQPTPEIITCREAGATVLQHQVGRLSVINARFKTDVKEHLGWLAIPFGVGIEEYADDIAKQVQNIPEDIKRLVVPCGSGMTLAGILRGLAEIGRDLPILAVQLGHDPTEYLNQFAPKDFNYRVTIVESGYAFEDSCPLTNWNGIELDPIYEAKCIQFLQPGDCFWIVGLRESSKRKNAKKTMAAAPVLFPVWHCGDSRNIDQICHDVEADFVFSCPPYADLEVYSDDPKDLSTMDYEEFLVAYREIIRKSCNLLKNNRFACFVVGDIRDKKGFYRNFVSHTIQAFEDAGLRYYNQAVLVTSVGSLPIRVGRQFEAARKLGMTHQHVQVFCKGDPKIATQECGPIEIHFPENMEQVETEKTESGDILD